MRRFIACVGTALFVVSFSPFASLSARNTSAKRLGNNAEGATLVSNGPGEAKVAVIDGYDVLVVPAGGRGKAPAHPLFDVKAHEWALFPSGIAYLGREKNFVFGDQGSLDELVVTNSGGHFLPTRPIQYLPGTPAVIGAEGMVYLGAHTAFPDTLARAVFYDDGTPAIEIMTRAGVVQQEIPIVGLPPEENYVTGLTYATTGQFLISTASPNIWTVSLDGAVTAGPVAVAEAGDVEGLVALPDGRVYASDYTAGMLFGLDANLARQPSLDRSYEIGVGLSRTFDAVWDPTTGDLLVNALDRDHAAAEIASVSLHLDSKEVLFQNALTFGLTILGDGSLATCQFFGPARILHYSRTGVLLDELNLTTIPGLLPQRCGTIAYLASIDAYALRLRGPGQGQTVYVVSRAGVLFGSFTVPVPISALSTRPDSGGERLLVWGPPQLFTYDPSGTLLSTRTLDTGPIVAPFGFAALPHGRYALLDPNNSEVAIF